eukprot:GHRQ01034600.1.p2 GENE.GHRQ01034600.1~~GHRQ01034600.1.p2  ORF type:complete len:110 (+),score=7.44 GHRQ01034600.1:180-509(+)
MLPLAAKMNTTMPPFATTTLHNIAAVCCMQHMAAQPCSIAWSPSYGCHSPGLQTMHCWQRTLPVVGDSISSVRWKPLRPLLRENSGAGTPATEAASTDLPARAITSRIY